jgi:hypothetical protein
MFTGDRNYKITSFFNAIALDNFTGLWIPNVVKGYTKT